MSKKDNRLAKWKRRERKKKLEEERRIQAFDRVCKFMKGFF